MNERSCRDKTEKKKVLVLGSGPIRIGQGIEFDLLFGSLYMGISNRKVIETVIINNNPETVSTDFDIADKLYFEPLTAEDVESYCQILRSRTEQLYSLVDRQLSSLQKHL